MITLMITLHDPDARKLFGARLKALRTAKDLLQKEVASAIGVQQNHYSKYESGTYIPPLDKAQNLADIFGVTLDYLVTGNQPDEQPIKNQHLLKRFQILENFSRHDQECIVTIIDAMIAKNRVQSVMEPLPL